MKPKYTSNFEYGKRMSKYTLIAAVILCLAGLLLAPNNSMAQMVLMFASLAAMVSTLVVMYRNCRCPYCGKHIMMGVLVVTSCPRCRRSLTTGKKSKKR